MNAEQELQLIHAAKKDPRNFAALYDAYVDLVWRYAMSRLGSIPRAEDATSQTFLQALRALPRFSPEVRADTTTFRSWLMMIARNVVFDELRRRDASLTSDGLRVIHDTAISPEQQAIASDDIDTVQRALSYLTPEHRLIVEMRAHGASVREISHRTGLTESAVKSAHYRAHLQLRRILAPQVRQSKEQSQ